MGLILCEYQKGFIMKIIFVFVFCLQVAFAQSMIDRYSNLGEMNILKLSTAPFPDKIRANGHEYNGRKYSVIEHYSDSSVAVFIPKGFKPKEKINIVVYFHGWYNNIDSACAQFKLIEQFTACGKNAIFVFPEGPKNSPDSYGGKLEGKNAFKNLINDVMKFLIENKKLKSKKIGDIILAGHSGAYRVMAYILMHGGLTKNISDVILFDALYAEAEKYVYWIDNYKGRFINIFTNEGGTKSDSEDLMLDFDGWGINYLLVDEKDLNEDELKKNRVIFIHSDLGHNEVIAKRDQFRKFLLTSKMK